MTFATRITRRTPIATIPASSLAAGATVVRRSGELSIIEAVSRPSRAHVTLSIDGQSARLPANAPVCAYVEA